MIEQAVILCGGLGPRLGAPIPDTPKLLLPVNDAPFLDLFLFELCRHGVRRILLLAGVGAARIAEYAATTPLRAQFGLDIGIIADPEAPGAGDAMRRARDRLETAFLLLNG